MSSSAAERWHAVRQQVISVLDHPNARSWSLVTGTTFMPIAAFGMAGGNALLSSTGILATGAIAVYLAATARLNKGRGKPQNASESAYLLDHVKDAMLHFDQSGNLLVTSKSCETLFGCPRYELAGGGIAERAHVLDRPLFMTAFSEAHIDGEERLIEVRMRRDTISAAQVAPEFVWVEVHLSPVRDHDKKEGPFGVIAVVRDISRRKRSEQEMLESQRLAEKASLAKSQFLAVIGHELRTPLNAIVGFSDMMSNGIGGKLEPTHAEYAELISQSGYHLLDVVNMLLDMSKIEAGKFELSTDRFDAESLVGPCLKIVSKAAREKRIDINVELGKNLPGLTGDERACRQILINLLSNAIKFSDDGGCVDWSLKRRGNSIVMTVADNGIGMNAEVLERVGEPFFQAESTAARRFEGTGLGMSIVKGLVELHDGRLSISSTPGVGTTIAVSLPIDGPALARKRTGGVTDIATKTPIEPQSTWSEPKRIAQ